MAPQRREASVETRWGAGDTEDPDIGGQEPAKTAQQRQKLGLAGVWGYHPLAGECARVGIRQGADRHIDMGHLPGGMDSRVGAAGCAEPNRGAENGRQRRIENTGDSALPGLSCPACEIGSVVGDI